jgi:hypothetical protein
LKFVSTFSILVAIIALQLARPVESEAQTSTTATAVAEGAGDLASIRMTRIESDPAVGTGLFALPDEQPDGNQGFARHMGLAYLAVHPEILEHKAAALGVAKLYLTDEAQARFIDDLGTPPANYQVWKGANEFQVERTFRSFVDEFAPILTEAAPSLPFDFWVVEQSTLGRYDFDRGDYEIFGPEIAKPFSIPNVGPAPSRELLARFGAPPGVRYTNFDNEIVVPGFLPMDAGHAEELTNLLSSLNDRNHIYFSAHVRVSDINTKYGEQRKIQNNTVTSFEGGIAIIELRSLALFADSGLTHLIHRYDDPTRVQTQ